MLFLTKLKFWIVTNAVKLLLGIVLIGGLYFAITTTISKFHQMEATIAQQKDELQNLRGQLQYQIELSKKIELETLAYQERLRLAEEYRDELIFKLQKHNLTKLSLEKPTLIENRINEATKKLFDDIESITRID